MADTSLLLTHAADMLKAVGMVCAGLWVAWTFHKLQKPLTAELDNRKKLVDIQKARQEQESLRTELPGHQPNPEIGIEATHYPDDSSPDHSFLSVTVTMTNCGAQNFEMVFPKSTLTVARVETTPNGKQRAAQVYRTAPWKLNEGSDTLQPFDPRIFRVGAIRRMVFVVRCTCPGLYLLQFQAPYCRILFDDDSRTRDKNAVWVNAVEQSVYSIRPQ